MVNRYRINLTKKERCELERVTKTGKNPGKKYRSARVLLLCDSVKGRKPWRIADVAEAVGVSVQTVINIKKRYIECGLEATLERKQREAPPREIKYDGAFDARLMQLACSPTPQGRDRWTVRLLSEKVVELNIAPDCSASAVCRSLKKTNCSRTAAGTGTSLQRTMAVS